MECRECGYIMDPFTAECPRCKRLKEHGIVSDNQFTP